MVSVLIHLETHLFEEVFYVLLVQLRTFSLLLVIAEIDVVDQQHFSSVLRLGHVCRYFRVASAQGETFLHDYLQFRLGLRVQRAGARVVLERGRYRNR